MSLRKFLPLTMGMPAIAIGIFAMYRNQVSIMIWGQNCVCLLVMICVSLIILGHKGKFDGIKSNLWIFVPALFLLGLTFVNPGMAGVHRWVSVGPLYFNVAMAVMPLLLTAVGWKLQTKGFLFGGVTVCATVLLLFFQPDASQLSGFAIPAMIMIYFTVNRKAVGILTVCVLLFLVFYAWLHLDSLAPVGYVEGIVNMIAGMGAIWLIFAVISLLLLPLPFLLFPPKKTELISRCLGFYYLIIIASAFLGNFPVPLMGYGMSPILGYYIALIWYIKMRMRSESM